MQNTDNYIHGMDWTRKDLSLSVLRNYRKYQYNLIGKYVGESILEVGSGDRSFTREIISNKLNFDTLVSIEPSETLFKTFEGLHEFPANVKFEQKDLFDFSTKGNQKFDTAILVHVLEHIEDDKEALDAIYNLMKPSGHALIQVPALQCLFSEHDKLLGHYRRYNRRMLKSIIDPQKFEIIKIYYQDPIGVIGSYLYFKLNKISLKSDEGENLISKQGKLYDKYVIPFEGFIEKFIRMPFGLSITAILKKR